MYGYKLWNYKILIINYNKIFNYKIEKQILSIVGTEMPRGNSKWKLLKYCQ